MLIAVAATVAVAAAVRSTWSPCGLSMLSSITPISERSKGHRFGVTAAWFVVGAVLGGMTLGAATAVLAAGVAAMGLSAAAAAALGAVALLAAAASDAPVGATLPFHRRQVNEDWLDQYRAWVYAGGFGWQIGVGFATYIMTATVYALVVLGAVTGEPAVAFLLGTGFGLVRGLAVLVTRGIRTPGELLELHRRFAAASDVSRAVVVVVALAASAALAATVAPVLAVAPAAVAVALAVGGRARTTARAAA